MSYRIYTWEEREKNKNRRITAEKTYDILNETVIQYDWQQQMILSVPKINNYSLRPPPKMEKITEQMDIDGTREEGNIATDYSLQDI